MVNAVRMLLAFNLFAWTLVALMAWWGMVGAVVAIAIGLLVISVITWRGFEILVSEWVDL